MENTRKQLIMARLAYVRRALDEILGRLTPEMMGWAPAEGMRTIAGQLLEIVGVELPRAELFLNIADHEHYHIGQLISYLWARGDDPYKW